MPVFDRAAVLRLFLQGWIVDGRGGGLVVGRSHAEGSVPLLVPTTHDCNEFEFSPGFTMQGGEYVVNLNAYRSAKERIDEINQFNLPSQPLSTVHVLPQSRLLNTHAAPNDKLLLLENGQFIINRNATATHYAELEAINDTHSDFKHCDFGKFQFEIVDID